jgi:4-amino-4-deoxy-L-arabinose transferase-like glycosyltransferase
MNMPRSSDTRNGLPVFGSFLQFLERHPSPLVLTLIVAGLLRFYLLDFFGLSSDEFATSMIVSKSAFDNIIKTCFVIPQPVPPFYFLLCELCVEVLGAGETGLRFLSVICGILTVYLVFLIGKILFDSSVAGWAALLCALNTTQILYAQMARPYALCLLLSSISILSFLRWLKKDSFLDQFSYVISTSLLLYSHYIFSPLLLIQGMYFYWCRRFARNTYRTTQSWVILQLAVAFAMAPLLIQNQILDMIHARRSLQWVSNTPHFKDVILFFKLKYLFFSAIITFICSWNPFRWESLRCPMAEADKQDFAPRVHGLVFLLLWYGLPPLLFYLLYLFTGINLMVERYLILISLASYLLIPAVALSIKHYRWGKTFVIVYVLYYVISAPILSYFKKGHFSQAMPGESQWRETFGALNNSAFKSSLLLFQSPYIEADQLDYGPNTPLFDYLSAPILSSHIRDTRTPFELLPHHWRTETAMQEKFNARIKRAVLGSQEFTLLCNQEFWEDFQAWLHREFTDHFEILSVKTFSSSQVLRLKKIRLLSKRTRNPDDAFLGGGTRSSVPKFRWKNSRRRQDG